PQSIVTPPSKVIAKSTTRKWVSMAVAVAIIALAGAFLALRLLNRPTAPAQPMTLIVADFNNPTGDPLFSGTLESTLRLALQVASFISAYDRTRMGDLGVRAISGTLDESKAQEIGANQCLNVVVSGALDRRGAEYRLSLRAVQVIT